MNDINISIVVPVYNAEKYLIDCIESLLNQTILKKEIIFVDDASIDSSYEIISKYKQRYEDIITIIRLEKNKGLSNARNKGIEIAKGDYIGFIDSDDFVSYNMFEEMYTNGKEKNLDIVVCDYKRINANEKYKVYFDEMLNQSINNIKLCSGKEIMQLLLDGNIDFGACNKIYKRSLIKSTNTKFPLGVYYEDGEFLCNLVSHSNNIGVCKNKFYYYRNNPNSITRKLTSKHIIDLKRSVDELKCICEKYDKKLDFTVQNIRTSISWVSIYNQNLKDDTIKNIYLEERCKIKAMKLISVLRVKNLNTRDKIKVTLIKLNLFSILLCIKNNIYKLDNK